MPRISSSYKENPALGTRLTFLLSSDKETVSLEQVLGIKKQGDHYDVIELLVASGAHTQLPHPRHFVILTSRWAPTGASVDRRGLEGRTPLYLAAEGGRLGAVDCSCAAE